MARKSNIPLHVYQVLEEEYLSLHGPIPAKPVEVRLSGRRAVGAAPPASPPHLSGPDDETEWRAVEAALDFDFRRGHIKEPALLAVDLIPRDELKDWTLPAELVKKLPSEDWSKENLKDFLGKRITSGLLKSLLGAGGEVGPVDSPPAGVATLEEALNLFLDDPDLYNPDHFSPAWMSPATRALVALRDDSLGGKFHGDDLRHFNRLLLEDAFPEIERIFNIRLAAICGRLHGAKQTALSLSGGGIRSGTFALGLLQGMARHNLLKEFDYLSTVSGGGYIGGWLTAWLHRHPEGLHGVTNDLANSPPANKIDPEPPPLLYLRQYSNFMTPKVGLLTPDTWTFIGIYLRNLLLNWIVFIPLLIALLLLPRLVLALTLAQDEPPPYLTIEWLGGFKLYTRHAFLIVGFALGAWALAFVNFNRPALGDRLRRSRSRFRDRTDQRSFVKLCLIPLLASAVLLTLYYAWSSEQAYGTKHFKYFFGFSIAFVLVSRVISWAVLSGGEEDAQGGKRAEAPKSWWKKVRQGSRSLFSVLAAGLIAALLLWSLSLLGYFGDPVVAYRPRRVDSQMFDYSTWTTWSDWTTELYVCFAVPLFLLVYWGATTVFVGISSHDETVKDEDREWWARFGSWLFISVILWVVANALVIFGPIALLNFPRVLATIGGLSGLAALVLGRSAKTPSHQKDDQAGGGLAAAVVAHALPVLGLVFLVAFVAALSLATSGLFQLIAYADKESLAKFLAQLTNANSFAEYSRYIFPSYDPNQPYAFYNGSKLVHLNVLHHTSVAFILIVGVIAGGLGLWLSHYINLNVFSLHGGYRNRLIRAFLGASRPPGERRANPFTGFDMADNIAMHELRPGLFDEDDFLDPVELRRRLLLPPDELAAAASPPDPVVAKVSARLSGHLTSLREVEDSESPKEVNKALSTDLNKALVAESLYTEFDSEYLRAGRALDIKRHVLAASGLQSLDREKLRTDYHILLNRVVLEAAFESLVKPSGYPPPPYKLMHVVNTALNLVGGDNLAWQQRKAEPFTISPLHSGCYRLGYRESRDYGGRDTGGISIGTAAAVSGAAASSNMGYYTTSPIISLLLTLFNVRLGWWLGNPGPHGHRTYTHHAPRSSVRPVVSEALGMTDDRNEYVYLSDGGHFENLAIYEMVLRRCHVIVCSDGAQDEHYRFGDLGNAVRKIRIDLGVPIEFTRVPIYAERPAAEQGRGLYFAIGRIRYSCVDAGAPDGVLLYVKPAVYGREPRDILEYKKNFPAFPHQSTGDQFFDEPQFESYRALGSFIMDQLCGEGSGEVDLYQMLGEAHRVLTAPKGDHKPTDHRLEAWMEDWLKPHLPTSPP